MSQDHRIRPDQQQTIVSHAPHQAGTSMSKVNTMASTTSQPLSPLSDHGQALSNSSNNGDCPPPVDIVIFGATRYNSGRFRMLTEEFIKSINLESNQIRRSTISSGSFSKNGTSGLRTVTDHRNLSIKSGSSGGSSSPSSSQTNSTDTEFELSQMVQQLDLGLKIVTSGQVSKEHSVQSPSYSVQSPSYSVQSPSHSVQSPSYSGQVLSSLNKSGRNMNTSNEGVDDSFVPRFPPPTPSNPAPTPSNFPPIPSNPPPIPSNLPPIPPKHQKGGMMRQSSSSSSMNGSSSSLSSSASSGNVQTLTRDSGHSSVGGHSDTGHSDTGHSSVSGHSDTGHSSVGGHFVRDCGQSSACNNPSPLKSCCQGSSDQVVHATCVNVRESPAGSRRPSQESGLLRQISGQQVTGQPTSNQLSRQNTDQLSRQDSGQLSRQDSGQSDLTPPPLPPKTVPPPLPPKTFKKQSSSGLLGLSATLRPVTGNQRRSSAVNAGRNSDPRSSTLCSSVSTGDKLLSFHSLLS